MTPEALSEEALLKRRDEIERSLRKKFKSDIFGKFVKAIVDYELLAPGDHIAVCISGGKDSMLMAMLFKELKRRNKIPFELTYLSMDPGYAEPNRRLISENADLLGLPLVRYEENIFDVTRRSSAATRSRWDTILTT